MKKLAIHLVFSLALSFSAFSAPVLTPKEVGSLIGPFPTYGSVEEANDDHVLLEYQATQTGTEDVPSIWWDGESLEHLSVESREVLNL